LADITASLRKKKRVQKKNNTSPVLIIGGGVAGITAALDLATAGQAVHLIEIGGSLGGQVAKLDKIYPTDHCAFCPLWTDIKRCREHPLIAVHTSSTLTELKKTDSYLNALIIRKPPVIDEERCIFCGRCRRECPAGAAFPAGAHTYPPVYQIDRDACTDCGACVTACPTGAIDFHRREESMMLAVSDVVWAAGFREIDVSPLKEFGYGSHRDIMTSLEFEKWTAEAGPNKGTILKKSDHSIPKNIAFIQCTGARNQKFLPYCSAVCCMHALKQAQWVQRRNPEIQCVILYTDLRTVGRDYYAYSLRQAGGNGIQLIRGRPSLIHPLPGGRGIAVKFEDTMTQKREFWKFDMVILNGNIGPSLKGDTSEKSIAPALTGEGFIDTGVDDVSRIGCGFSLEPADVAEAVIQASSAAVRMITRRFRPTG
jgi:heterodisulfide reductase subunit A